MAVSLWLTQPTDNILLQTLSRQSFGKMGVEQLTIGRGCSILGQVEEISGWWICHKKCRCESDSGQLTTMCANDILLEHSQIQFYTISAGSLKRKYANLNGHLFPHSFGQWTILQKMYDIYSLIYQDRTGGAFFSFCSKIWFLSRTPLILSDSSLSGLD